MFNQATITDLVRGIASLCTAKTAEGAADRIRKTLDRHGIDCLPLGVGNEKTELPGLYRPVGVTCPSSCPYLNNGCYAQGGHVDMSQRRASVDVDQAIVALIAIVALAQRYAKGSHKAARVLVSGDIYKADKVDAALVVSWYLVGKALQAHYGQSVIAYGYTHGTGEACDAAVALLRSAGIVLVRSGHHVAGGAVVGHHATLPKRTTSDARYVACPAQREGSSVSCASCTLCVRGQERNVCVVFEPHGQSKKSVKVDF